MALQLNTPIPLAAIGQPLNPAGMIQQAQQNATRAKADALAQRLAELKADALAQRLAELKADFEARKIRQQATQTAMGEELAKLTQGTPAVPAQTSTQYIWQQPREVTDVPGQPAIPGRQPTMQDIQQAHMNALFKAGDMQGLLEALKAAKLRETQQPKVFAGTTKTSQTGEEYALNQMTGQYEPTGFTAAPAAATPKIQMVQTARGIEAVDMGSIKPGTVLPAKPMEEKPDPALSPEQKLTYSMKRSDAFKALDSLDQVTSAYRNALKGASRADLINPYSDKNKEIASLATQMQMAYKTAAELGAITGPDWAIINRIVATPSSIAGIVSGTEGLTQQLDQIQKMSARDRSVLQRKFDQADKIAGFQPQQSGTQNPAVRSVVPAVGFLKSRSITTQAQFEDSVRALRAKGWTDDEIRQAAAKAGL